MNSISIKTTSWVDITHRGCEGSHFCISTAAEQAQSWVDENAQYFQQGWLDIGRPYDLDLGRLLREARACRDSYDDDTIASMFANMVLAALEG